MTWHSAKDDAERASTFLAVGDRLLGHARGYDDETSEVEVDIAEPRENQEPTLKIAGGESVTRRLRINGLVVSHGEKPENNGWLYWADGVWLDEKSSPIYGPMADEIVG